MDHQTDITPAPPPTPEPNVACCSPAVQATCCAPSEKAECCDHKPASTGCGCR
jgi:arsenite methyltransferase